MHRRDTESYSITVRLLCRLMHYKNVLLRSFRPVLCSLFLVLAGACLLSAQYGETDARYQGFVSKKGVGIDQKLNSSVPLDLVFNDESNRSVPLRAYFGDKPVLLAMVYFDCPGLCGLTLSNLVHSMKQVNLQPGRDYNVVVVSFNPAEKSNLAAAKKASYAAAFEKPSFNDGWHFLTGDQQSINKLASAVGFRYRWDEPTHQFVHAAGIMVATPTGKLSRYFYGIRYEPTDLRLALVAASGDKIGSPVDYVLLFCCPYDPLTGKYTVTIYNVLKLAGAVTLFCLIAFILLLNYGGKKRRARPVPQEATAGR